MNRWRTEVVALFVIITLGILYLMTIPSGPTWGDGLEFTCAVHTLGIPHPTGYPLYIMLGKVWSLIVPLGDLAVEMHLYSVMWGLVAALLMYAAMREAMPAERDWEDVPMPHEWRRVLIPGGAALAWGLTPAVWQSANIAEVYTLLAVFFNALVWLMLRNLRLNRGWIDALIAFLFGLSLTHHRLVIVLGPALLGFYVVRLLRRRRAEQPLTRWIFWCLGAGLIGLLPLLYLPIRAKANPALNWGDPSTLENLIWTLRGGEYMQTKFLATEGRAWLDSQIPGLVWERIEIALALLVGEIVPLMNHSMTFAKITAVTLAVLMAVGCWHCRPALRWSAPVTFFLSLLMVGIYNIGDFHSYMIPVVTVTWLWVAFGLLQVSEWLERMMLRRRFTYTPLVLGVLPVWLALQFYTVCDRSQSERADVWADRVLERVRPDSLLLTRGDGDIYALWHAQMVEGQRPDITVFGTNFMWNGWYANMFTQEELETLHIEDVRGPTDARYFLTALIGGTVAPSLDRGWDVHTCFNLYESQGNLLLTLWQNPAMFGQDRYEIFILDDQTRQETGHVQIGPPLNPLLAAALWDKSPQVSVQLGGGGEPSPLLFRVQNNPVLSARARALSEAETAEGYQSWRSRQTVGFIEGAFFGR